MRLLHCSDRHGIFPLLRGNFDAVLDTGDMSPDFAGDIHTNTAMQMYWWEEAVPTVKEWLQGRPLLFTGGNHDMFSAFWLQEMLRSHNINATCLHDRIISLNDVNFYGFPYVPPICGRYNYESTTEQMDDHLSRMGKAMNQTYVDVIAAHCMPGNILDLDHTQTRRFGNSQMNSFLDYTLADEMRPKYYLGGHIHQSAGIKHQDGILYSNAATIQIIIEIV